MRSMLRVLMAFNARGKWFNAAVGAVAVAPTATREQLDARIEAALAAEKDAPDPTPATARLILCMALVAAQRHQEARAMAQQFLIAADREIVSVSGAFGRPILAYLFARLEMEDQIQQLIVFAPGDFRNPGVIQAVGTAEAEMGDWQRVEQRYRRLTDSWDRLHYSVGVLAVLNPPAPASQPAARPSP